MDILHIKKRNYNSKISFVTKKLHNKFRLSTYAGDYVNVFQLFLTVIFR